MLDTAHAVALSPSTGRSNPNWESIVRGMDLIEARHNFQPSHTPLVPTELARLAGEDLQHVPCRSTGKSMCVRLSKFLNPLQEYGTRIWRVPDKLRLFENILEDSGHRKHTQNLLKSMTKLDVTGILALQAAYPLPGSCITHHGSSLRYLQMPFRYGKHDPAQN
jgi:hypothetical protein